MDRELLAWAAGFFDGEGNAQLNKKSYPRVQINQLDREVLDRFTEAVGVGKVYGPYQHNSHKNSYFQYQVNGFERVQAVMAMLWPWLGSAKRSQFAAVL